MKGQANSLSCALEGKAGALNVFKAVLTLDEIQTSNIRFNISVTGDGREVKGLGARGIFGEER